MVDLMSANATLDLFTALFPQSTLTCAAMLRKYIHMDRDSKKIIQRLQAEGWVLRAVKGSHHQFVKGDLRVTVPHPKKDLPTGTARVIAKTAGWV
jgi:predicted RNA binding protein YcfA (HicA-like mRNA interferase family)